MTARCGGRCSAAWPSTATRTATPRSSASLTAPSRRATSASTPRPGTSTCRCALASCCASSPARRTSSSTASRGPSCRRPTGPPSPTLGAPAGSRTVMATALVVARALPSTRRTASAPSGPSRFGPASTTCTTGAASWVRRRGATTGSLSRRTSFSSSPALPTSAARAPTLSPTGTTPFGCRAPRRASSSSTLTATSAARSRLPSPTTLRSPLTTFPSSRTPAARTRAATSSASRCMARRFPTMRLPPCLGACLPRSRKSATSTSSSTPPTRRSPTLASGPATAPDTTTALAASTRGAPWRGVRAATT
mmetsp:Transcript_15406/g.38710  ORF Transcript_15406/g.38710 Transcript_15406/m.38710 type:complete len:308 (+) Transcript_15406:346-1269(+)